MEELFSKRLIKVAHSWRGLDIIFSYGAFGIWGLSFRVGERAWYFDAEADPSECLASYVTRHTEAEILDKVYNALNGDKFLDSEDKEYCAKELRKFENKEEFRYFYESPDEFPF